MADADRAEAVCEVQESVLGQTEECSCGAKVTEFPKPWCLNQAHLGTAIRRPGLSLFDQWQAEFKPLLGTSGRWEGFCYLMRDQLEREKPCVLETGTLRQSGNWRGDGQSTRLWDWLAEHKTGFVVSVDRDWTACGLARQECGERVHIVCDDSISFLRGFLPLAPTLLYLDSIEWGATRESNVDCWMNQVGELAAIWGRLPSGCLIASDDSQSPDVGKPVLTRRMFQALGIEPEHDSYIVVWRKP